MRSHLEREVSPTDEPDLVADVNRRAMAINMNRGEVIGLENPLGAALHLYTGQLWITQSDDYRDIIVEPGHVLRLDRGGLALVSATKDSTLTIRPDENTRLNRLRFDRRR